LARCFRARFASGRDASHAAACRLAGTISSLPRS
jgi:hypothetical protein